jgi:hypothetical protein
MVDYLSSLRWLFLPVNLKPARLSLRLCCGSVLTRSSQCQPAADSSMVSVGDPISGTAY